MSTRLRFAAALVALAWAALIAAVAASTAPASASPAPSSTVVGNRWEEVTCQTASMSVGYALHNGDHINMEIRQAGRTFQVNAYVDRHLGGFEDLGVRMTTPAGQLTRPLTEAEVLIGVLTFDYAEHLEGSYTVVWVQFNDRYFNQDRTSPGLDCGTDPTPTPSPTPTPEPTQEPTWTPTPEPTPEPSTSPTSDPLPSATTPDTSPTEQSPTHSSTPSPISSPAAGASTGSPGPSSDLITPTLSAIGSSTLSPAPSDPARAELAQTGGEALLFGTAALVLTAIGVLARVVTRRQP